MRIVIYQRVVAGLFAWGALMIASDSPAATASKPDAKLVFEARPSKEIVAQIARRFSANLEVDRELAEDKVTLVVSILPLSAIKQHLARVLDADWKAQERDGMQLSVLTPSPARRAYLLNVARARVEAAQRTAVGIRSSLERQMAQGEPRRRTLSPTYTPGVYPIVQELPAGVVDQALANANPPGNGSEGGKTPSVVIPVRSLSEKGKAATGALLGQWADELQSRFPEKPTGAIWREFAGDPSQLTLELWCEGSSRTFNSGSLYLSFIAPNGDRMLDTLLARGGASANESKPTPPPGMTRSPNVPGLSLKEFELPPGRYRHDRLMSLIARRVGFNLVSDYFTRSTVVSIQATKYVLGQFLEDFDRQFQCIHRWNGNTLLMRSSDWGEALLVEPTADVVARVEEIGKLKSGPTMDDLTQIAKRVNDHQLATLEFHTEPDGRPLPLNLVPRLRMNNTWLQAYAALSSAQRKKAESAAGLVLNTLPLQTRTLWVKPAAAMGFQFLTDAAALVLFEGPSKSMRLPGWTAIPTIGLSIPSVAVQRELWRNGRSY